MQRSRSRISCPWCRCSMLLCRRWWTSWWTSSRFSTLRSTSMSSKCQRSHRTPSHAVFEPQLALAAHFASIVMDTNGSESRGPLVCTSGTSPTYYTQWEPPPPPPPPPGGIHRQPRAVYKYWARLTTSLVSSTLCSSSSSTEWWKSVVAGCHDSYAQWKLGRTSEIPQRSSWMVVDAPVVCDNRCWLWRKVLAQCSVRQWIHVLQFQGGLLEELTIFSAVYLAVIFGSRIFCTS